MLEYEFQKQNLRKHIFYFDVKDDLIELSKAVGIGLQILSDNDAIELMEGVIRAKMPLGSV